MPDSTGRSAAADADSAETAADPPTEEASGSPETGDTSGGAGADTADGRPPASTAKKLPPAAKRKVAVAQKAPSGSSASRRYTAPTTAAKKGPSPRWVPVLMFAFWIAGLLLIILNYMGVLPGSADSGNGWYLVGGLASILAGIITATQYR
jgi:hypothetical protein